MKKNLRNFRPLSIKRLLLEIAFFLFFLIFFCQVLAFKRHFFGLLQIKLSKAFMFVFG